MRGVSKVKLLRPCPRPSAGVEAKERRHSRSTSPVTRRVVSQHMTDSHTAFPMMTHRDVSPLFPGCFSAYCHDAMTDDARSPKRRRVSASSPTIHIVDPGAWSPSESDSDADGGKEKYARDLDFWLEDGNLILLAGPSAFRVYRGLLTRNSPVFADMFTAGSAGATETFDNCPVVRLVDHPQDLRDFLQYLMPCSPLA